MNHPICVIHKCAVSLDGSLDDTGPERLLLSSAEDFDRLDEVRASCDAILVGAATIRRDCPRLLIRSEARRRRRLDAGLPEHPFKVTLTRSGRLDPEAPFFTQGTGPKLVYCVSPAAGDLRARLGERAVVIPVESEQVEPEWLLRDLAECGVRRLLLEGGSTLATQFHAGGWVEELQLSVAPFFVGEAGAPRLVNPARFAHDVRWPMQLLRVEQLGQTAVLTYRSTLPRDRELLLQAVELSRRCPPSDRAFSVGAILTDIQGTILATGYSRETEPRDHAEEIALRKAQAADADPRGGTLYSSLEPCSVRLSGQPACADLLVAAGIARVVFALHEPPVFVTCAGAERLTRAGVAVHVLPELAELVRAVNRHLLVRTP
jgi:5-amino-6-(5-phosphoribosylamino)uracil reductase